MAVLNATIQLLDLTLPTGPEDLALDEALLETTEQSREPRETLRIWEPRQMIVVVGNSSRIEQEVNIEACQAARVPVLRRPSGGAAIVAGPGCLMYSLVIRHADRSELSTIDRTHRFVLERIAEALRRNVPDVRRAGTSDLALGNRKFSGNSLRWKRTHLLYHGTLLYQFPLAELGRLLKMPPHQPQYRDSRGHEEFVMNLPLTAAEARGALVDAFQAAPGDGTWPRTLTEELAATKYSRPEWNRRC